jgi:hypothetical protein
LLELVGVMHCISVAGAGTYLSIKISGRSEHEPHRGRSSQVLSVSKFTQPNVETPCQIVGHGGMTPSTSLTQWTWDT